MMMNALLALGITMLSIHLIGMETIVRQRPSKHLIISPDQMQTCSFESPIRRLQLYVELCSGLSRGAIYVAGGQRSSVCLCHDDQSVRPRFGHDAGDGVACLLSILADCIP